VWIVLGGDVDDSHAPRGTCGTLHVRCCETQSVSGRMPTWSVGAINERQARHTGNAERELLHLLTRVDSLLKI